MNDGSGKWLLHTPTLSADRQALINYHCLQEADYYRPPGPGHAEKLTYLSGTSEMHLQENLLGLYIEGVTAICQSFNTLTYIHIEYKRIRWNYDKNKHIIQAFYVKRRHGLKGGQ